MKKNRAKLIALMADNGLTCLQVAKMLNRQYSTIKAWRCRTGRDITDNELRLFELLCK